MSKSRYWCYVDAHHYFKSVLFWFNLDSSSNVLFSTPDDLRARENCHSHLRQNPRCSVPRSGPSSLGNVPVQAHSKRKVVHLTLHTILQYFGVLCHLALVKHPGLRLQELDNLGTSEVARGSILRLLRVLRHDNRTCWHYLRDTCSSIDFRVGPREEKHLHLTWLISKIGYKIATYRVAKTHIGYLQLLVSFCKKTTNYRALLPKWTY